MVCSSATRSESSWVAGTGSPSATRWRQSANVSDETIPLATAARSPASNQRP